MINNIESRRPRGKALLTQKRQYTVKCRERSVTMCTKFSTLSNNLPHQNHLPQMIISMLNHRINIPLV